MPSLLTETPLVTLRQDGEKAKGENHYAHTA